MTGLCLHLATDVIDSGIQLLLYALIASPARFDRAAGAFRSHCVCLAVVKLQRVLLVVGLKVSRKAIVVRLVQGLLVLVLRRTRLLKLDVERL